MEVLPTTRPGVRRPLGNRLVHVFGFVILGVLLWQALAAHGAPDPLGRHISPFAAIVDIGVLVFREGLEAILVLAAITASLVRRDQDFWPPVFAGAGTAFLATIATWFAVVALLTAIPLPELDVQAATGLLAILVLLLVLNWFFHKVYWTGWISLHTQRKNEIMASSAGGRAAYLGLALLGFTCVYREGFEVVLFLQSIRMQVGSGAVAIGAAMGLVLTLMVAHLTFRAHQHLPYRRMLVLTGVMLGAVLLVMVGESVQELQAAGWLATTMIRGAQWAPWLNLWFAVYPSLESLIAQGVAALVVLGSYGVAEYQRVWKPRRLARGQALPEH